MIVSRRTAAALLLLLVSTPSWAQRSTQRPRRQRRPSSPQPPQQPQQPVVRQPPWVVFDLVVGQEESLDATGIASYSEGGSIIEVRVSPDGSRLLFRAVALGSSTLLLIYNNGDQRRVEFNVR